MPTYNLTTPGWLWAAYKTTVPHSQTLDEPLVDHIAQRVLKDASVDPELRAEAAAFLGEDLPEHDGSDRHDDIDEEGFA